MRTWKGKRVSTSAPLEFQHLTLQPDQRVSPPSSQGRCRARMISSPWWRRRRTLQRIWKWHGTRRSRRPAMTWRTRRGWWIIARSDAESACMSWGEWSDQGTSPRLDLEFMTWLKVRQTPLFALIIAANPKDKHPLSQLWLPNLPLCLRLILFEINWIKAYF